MIPCVGNVQRFLIRPRLDLELALYIAPPFASQLLDQRYHQSTTLERPLIAKRQPNAPYIEIGHSDNKLIYD